MLKTTTRALFATLAVGGLLAVPAMATASDTTVTFTIAASGTLAIDQGLTPSATLTNKVDAGQNLGYSSSLAGIVTGTLPETTVTDTRGSLVAAWTVDVVAMGDWLNSTDNAITVGAEQGRAYIAVADTAALVTAVALNPTDGLLTGGEFTVGVNDLGTEYTLLSGTSTTGNMSIAYTPTVDITIPAATPAGEYTATVQQTVS